MTTPRSWQALERLDVPAAQSTPLFARRGPRSGHGHAAAFQDVQLTIEVAASPQPSHYGTSLERVTQHTTYSMYDVRNADDPVAFRLSKERQLAHAIFGACWDNGYWPTVLLSLRWERWDHELGWIPYFW